MTSCRSSGGRDGRCVRSVPRRRRPTRWCPSRRTGPGRPRCAGAGDWSAGVAGGSIPGPTGTLDCLVRAKRPDGHPPATLGAHSDPSSTTDECGRSGSGATIAGLVRSLSAGDEPGEAIPDSHRAAEDEPWTGPRPAGAGLRNQPRAGGRCSTAPGTRRAPPAADEPAEPDEPRSAVRAASAWVRDRAACVVCSALRLPTPASRRMCRSYRAVRRRPSAGRSPQSRRRAAFDQARVRAPDPPSTEERTASVRRVRTCRRTSCRGTGPSTGRPVDSRPGEVRSADPRSVEPRPSQPRQLPQRPINPLDPRWQGRQAETSRRDAPEPPHSFVSPARPAPAQPRTIRHRLALGLSGHPAA